MEILAENGILRGIDQDGIHIFYGVPYAAPPVGDGRFMAPRPLNPWRGVRDATTAAEPSLQPAIDTTAPVFDYQDTAIGSEDCLYLNVYAPADAGQHPVLVWIHGGGGVVGAATDNNGVSFARDGIVTVTVSYRLGVLGLLRLHGVFDDASCNLALLDQLAALHWVKDNIVHFGGDPDQVTIAGSSNGGRSVGAILAAPGACGLYRQAIIQSGTGVGYVIASPEEGDSAADALLAELGLTRRSASQLRDLGPLEILAAQTQVYRKWPTILPFQLCTDPSTLPERPIDAVRNGSATGVKLLIGTAHDEQDAFAMRKSGIRALVEPKSMVVSEETRDEVKSAYRRLLPDDWSNEEVTRHVLTSSEWWIPAVKFAEAHVDANGQAWMYRTDWRLTPRKTGFGAIHGVDHPLVWNEPDNPLTAQALLSTKGCEDRKYKMASIMHARWVQFIRQGSLDDSIWPPYDLEQRATYIFDDSSVLALDPDRELRMVWQDLV